MRESARECVAIGRSTHWLTFGRRTDTDVTYGSVCSVGVTIYPLSEVGTKATQFKVNKMPDGSPVRMPADTFLETSIILDLLQMTDIPPKATISAEISLDDFVSAITIWNENTSTSPS
jgi:hypothetical protein